MGTQSRTIPVVLTRPAAQGQRFAQTLTERMGKVVRLIHSPLLVPEFLSPTVPDKTFHGVVFTSEAAVEGSIKLRQAGARLPSVAYCVGDRTAEMAQQAGFDAISAKGDATQLISTIKSGRISGKLLYLRGEDTRGQVAERLGLAGIETVEVVLYAQRAQHLTDKAMAAIAKPHPIIFPVFSPRTGLILLNELRQTSVVAPLVLVAISDAVADALAPQPFHKIFVAHQPDADAMLQIVEQALAAVLPA
jgi:uroporphyrinogen-III synthase